MRLKDKAAVVTGAGRGIGEGIALRFAEEGAKLIVKRRSYRACSTLHSVIVPSIYRAALPDIFTRSPACVQNNSPPRFET